MEDRYTNHVCGLTGFNLSKRKSSSFCKTDFIHRSTCLGDRFFDTKCKSCGTADSDKHLDLLRPNEPFNLAPQFIGLCFDTLHRLRAVYSVGLTIPKRWLAVDHIGLPTAGEPYLCW